MTVQKKVCLIIMDGWGINNDPNVSAIAAANTPFVDSLFQSCPNTTLLTYGAHVGLPEGQMGNSEVGHMNIGAGKVVYQELQRINNAIETGELAEQEALKNAFSLARLQQRPIHFIGLVSDGGIHSHVEHLKGLIKLANSNGITSYIHAFTDGRDTDPKSGTDYLEDLEVFCNDKNARIASVVGRYYAMDRDKRWDRIKQAYDLLVKGVGKATSSAVTAVQQSYAEGITDEFILPISVRNDDDLPVATILPGDIVICFNFRTDRCREITQVLTQTDMPEYGMHTVPLHYVTMTVYDERYKGIFNIFSKDNLENTLGEVISNSGLTQLRIAETEKYPHVTFFFSGGRENVFPGEERIMIQSPMVATYDLQPEMSAPGVRDAVIKNIEEKQPHFICLNFANTDMVGHTGVFSAAMQAAETVDQCVEAVAKTALAHDYAVFITADHGNADVMVNPDGSPNTAHSMSPVPFFILDKDWKGTIRPGKLGDLAPTILTMMNIPIPPVMTGNILI